MNPRPYLPILLLLFIGSGCAALIYEVVWFQLLQLAIGSSAVSLGALLGTFMGGMCLGSLLLPRKVPASQHPLKVYGWIELGIGALGLIVLFAIPWIDRLYASIASTGFNNVFARAIVAALCLLPPTLLMGASLPAIARWIESTPQGISWLGFFYGGNIAGAVFGCLLAGFYLLRVYDMPFATYVAVAINIAVGLAALALAEKAEYKPTEQSAGQKQGVQLERERHIHVERERQVHVEQERHVNVEQERRGYVSRKRSVYAVIALSGLCALGAEVVWTRLLATMMGATVYTFSIILAVFLIGLGIGSSVGSIIARSSERPRIALGWAQMLAAFGIAWTAYMLSVSVPNWPIDPLLSSSVWFNFQVDLMRTFWTVLPPALFWGASFPLAMAAIAAPGDDPGRVAGETYAANTVGAILGAVLFSVVVIPWIGTQGAQQTLMALATFAALLALMPIAQQWARPLPVLTLAAAFIGIVIAIQKLDRVPWKPLAYGRRAITTPDAGNPLYVGEGMNSSIVISETPAGRIYFHVSGKTEASTEPFDMRLQRMLGHISALAHNDPKSVLIVGFGAGVTAGSFTRYPGILKIVICEMEKLIPPAATQYFEAENYNVLNDARTEIHYDDARHFVLTTNQKFDIITSDPIHPWVKGAATLYSKEYFEECKRHLNPGGVITQWVPLYESDLETVRSEIATFFEVFPNGTIWANNVDGRGYDVVLLAQNEPSKIDVDKVQTRLNQNPGVAASLSEVGFAAADELLSTYAGSASRMGPWLRNAQINRDMNLRLQYLAGMGAINQHAATIMDEIVQFRDFPEDLFQGSPESLERLKQLFSY